VDAVANLSVAFFAADGPTSQRFPFRGVGTSTIVLKEGYKPPAPPAPAAPFGPKGVLTGITVDAASAHYPTSGDCNDVNHCKVAILDGCTSHTSCAAHGTDRAADVIAGATYSSTVANSGVWFMTDCTGNGVDCSTYKTAFDAEFGAPGNYKTGMVTLGGFTSSKTVLDEVCFWADTSGSYHTEYMLPANFMLVGDTGSLITWSWTLTDYPNAGVWMCKEVTPQDAAGNSLFSITPSSKLTLLIQARSSRDTYSHIAELLLYGRLAT